VLAALEPYSEENGGPLRIEQAWMRARVCVCVVPRQRGQLLAV
jgi:hypothetical protein